MKVGNRWKMRHPPPPGVPHHTGGKAHTDPETTSSLMMALSHHLPLFLPKAACLPDSQPGARFWRDLGRRPVLLWTAHSAARAAAPCVSRRRQGANAVPAAPGAPGAAARRSGGVRRGKTLSLATSNPTLGRASRLGAPRPGEGVRPRLPGVGAQCAWGAERALRASSRPSGPLGCLGPASRSPTPRSRRPSRPHPGSREPRTLGMSGGAKKDAACMPALFSALRRGPAGPSRPGARGGPPRPPLEALRRPGSARTC